MIQPGDVDELPLREQAYLHIKRLILNEELPPNSFLSERGLAQQLGMSKTPVRLAIARLENEGFVRVSPQQGIVVLALSFEEVLEHIDFRLALEGYVVKRLAGSLSRSQAKVLHEHIRQQQTLAQNPKTISETLVYADMAFHRQLASTLGNRQITQALERQQDMLYRVAHRVYQKHPTRREQSIAEHQRLVELLIEGAKAEALELIELHITRIKSLLISASAS
ncbi:GntR family transcriptional regulator [Meiothermus cerbereus]|uniref:GntR family transcriptional regulator n=1 Tax=Meiothermus cerbereus TaxID=65552 RepID=UPI003EEB07E2